MIFKIDKFLRSYWLKDPSWGLRRVLFFYFILFTLVFIAWWRGESFFLLITLGLVLYLTIFVLKRIHEDGYYRRLEEFSDLGEILEVSDLILPNNKGKRYLKIKTGGWTYSCSFLNQAMNRRKSAYLDFVRKVFEKKFVKKHEGLNLFLGGGGCVLPLFISQKYPKTRNYVVEISPKMADVVSEYFYPLFGLDKKNSPNLKIKTKDAQEFIKEDRRKYDFIFQDICIGREVPQQFLNKQWTNSLIEHLRGGGLLMINAGVLRPGKGDYLGNIISLFFSFVWINSQLFLTRKR